MKEIALCIIMGLSVVGIIALIAVDIYLFYVLAQTIKEER